MNSSSDQFKHTYARQWTDCIPALVGAVECVVAGYPTRVQITADQLTTVYFPLLHELDRVRKTVDSRILAGLAGIPGSGKSTFAATVEYIADLVLGKGSLAVVGMDGWHWPNAVLHNRNLLDEAGNEIPLSQFKGGPESFDVDGLVRSLRRLSGAKDDVALPVYDRRIHEPVVGGMTIAAQTRMVLVEGNYVLSRTPPWDQVSALLAPKLFLACAANLARGRTIARHIRGGMTDRAAADKYEMNDRRNADIILPDLANADLVISIDPEPNLTRRTYKTG
jgi:pantothenate kinase